MKLVDLHRQFINESTRPLITVDVPIKVKNPDRPIIALEKWSVKDDHLTKKFTFENLKDRNQFITSLLRYEEQAGHNASFIINENEVSIKIITNSVNKITELDKEYARYADIIRKDIAYNTIYE
jgi:hypothetical protein